MEKMLANIFFLKWLNTSITTIYYDLVKEYYLEILTFLIQ